MLARFDRLWRNYDAREGLCDSHLDAQLTLKKGNDVFQTGPAAGDDDARHGAAAGLRAEIGEGSIDLADETGEHLSDDLSATPIPFGIACRCKALFAFEPLRIFETHIEVRGDRRRDVVTADMKTSRELKLALFLDYDVGRCRTEIKQRDALAVVSEFAGVAKPVVGRDGRHVNHVDSSPGFPKYFKLLLDNVDLNRCHHYVVPAGFGAVQDLVVEGYLIE